MADGARYIGRYEVVRPLGAGSFATVWLCYSALLEAHVAVKVLAENWALDPETRRRFIEEAKILWRLDDERIVRVHLVDELPDGRPYFVMGLADRGTLKDHLDAYRARQELYTPEDAAAVLMELCDGLAVVHAAGVVHRDIKPSNILYRSGRTASGSTAVGRDRMVLGDFGLARSNSAGSAFTLAGGTPAYMAPEQAYPTIIPDARADVFAATAVFAELLTGVPPFRTTSLDELRNSPRPAPRLSSFRPALPPVWQELLDGGLTADPALRFPDIITLRGLVEDAVGGGASPAPGTVIGDVGPVEAPSPALGSLTDTVRDRLVELLAGVEAYSQSNAKPSPALAVARRRVGRPPRLVALSLGPVAATTLRAGTVVEVISVQVDEVASEALESADAVGIITDGTNATPQTMFSGLTIAPAFTLSITSPQDEGATALTRATTRHAALEASAIAYAMETIAKEIGGSFGRAIGEESQALVEADADVAELVLARRIVGGKAKLPGPLAAEALRWLIEQDASRRLGLAPGSPPEAIRAAAETGMARWRGLLNAGRIPFAGRVPAEEVIRALERTWLAASPEHAEQ